MNFTIRIQSAISNLKRFPNYPAYSVRPDTFFGAKLYRFVLYFFHPIDFLLSHFILKRSINTQKLSASQIDQKKGFLTLNLSDDPIAQKTIQFCRKLFATDPQLLTTENNIKSFLLQKWLEPSDVQFTPIWDLATHPEIVSRVTNYLGFVPILGSATLWHSPNKNFEAGRSQMYHLDGEDLQQIKVFFLIEDVDRDCGPLTFIEAQRSRDIFYRLKKSGKIHMRNQKCEDSDIEPHCNPNEIHQFTGKSGMLAFVDTDNCYHYGSRPAKKPRYLLQLQYLGPHSRHQPAWGRSISPAILERYKDDQLTNLKSYVLGFAHLAFPKIKNIKPY